MNKKRLIIACSAAAAIAAGYLMYENLTVGLTEYTYVSEKVPEEFDGFKICHLSDIHVKSERNFSGIIKLCAEQSPDIIVITGDLIHSESSSISCAASLTETLCDIAPVYYVTGNHEEGLSTERYIEALTSLSAVGVHILDGKAEKIFRSQSYINILGVSDSSEPDLGEISELCDSETLNLLLSHRPQFAESYASAGADLTFTGHAHGGQMRLPIVGGVIAPDQYFFPEYYEGMHFFGDSATVISRGLGNSLIPIRVNNRPEVIAMTLKHK